MSIYHFSVNIQSKAIGSSPLATLAYQCRTSVYDAVNRKTFSYKGADFVYSGVCLPKNAPEKYRDPITLWTDVLLNESQTNAQLCRRFNCSLPNELSDDDNKKIIENFAEYMSEQGMCVTYAYHNKSGNKHVHFQTTCRGLDDKGNWETIKTKKDYRLDSKGNRIPVLLDDNGKKIPLKDILDSNGVVRTDLDLSKQKKGTRNALIWERVTVSSKSGKSLEWDSKDTFESWRKKWADVCNEQLKNTGIKSRIDHRSLERQSLETELSTNELKKLSTQEKIDFLEDKLSVLFKEKNSSLNNQHQVNYSYDLEKEFSYDRYEANKYDFNQYQPISFYIGSAPFKRKIKNREMLLPELQACNMVNFNWGDNIRYVPLHSASNKVLQQSGRKLANCEVVLFDRVNDYFSKKTPAISYSIPELKIETIKIVEHDKCFASSDKYKKNNLVYNNNVLTKKLAYKVPSLLNKIVHKISELASFVKYHISNLVTNEIAVDKVFKVDSQIVNFLKQYEFPQKLKENKIQPKNNIDSRSSYEYMQEDLKGVLDYESNEYSDFENESVFLIASNFYSVDDLDDMVRNKEISLEDLKTALMDARKDYWNIYRTQTSISEMKITDEPLIDKKKEVKHVRRI